MEKKFEWCGYEWTTCAGGGRLIHPNEPNYWYDSDCVTLDSDGVLAFDIHENPREIKYWDGKVYHPFYGVGLIRSVKNFSYGIFECECKMPIGEELCSAFWLSGDEAWPPEIDIAENMSNSAGKYRKYLFWWNVNTNLHYWVTASQYKDHVGSKRLCALKFPDPSANWLKYKCVWRSDSVEFYVNDRLVRVINDKKILSTYDGFTQHVVFDNWPWHANQYGTRIHLPLKQPFMIRNFKYTSL